ncbi:aminodeoxychorismate lyase [Shouchella shacheensis]|uniref:aminodeoxychorismate lyase n=1 Tax=Shouchella shacheensis TaxID=1649580 RepID=UPI0007400840|nr:aminodeoxychorismate lyase [Shouchella shacheensis]
MYVYVNGEILPKEQATVSVFDHGFMYGLGLFETFRMYNGKPFLLAEHLDRLSHSAEEVGISYSFSLHEVQKVLDELMMANGLRDAYVRWNVSAGAGGLGLQSGVYTTPTLIVYMKPLPTMPSSKRAHILSLRRNTPEGEKRWKSHHFMNNALAKQELFHDPQAEGIFLTKDGYLAEGIVSNLFWVKEGTVYTPSLSTGILNGVTRKFVIRLLEEQGTPVVEGLFTRTELNAADEVFVTNSIQEVVPITAVHHTMYQMSTVSDGLRQAYRKAVHEL